MDSSPIKVKLATASDVPFVGSSWFRSFRPYARRVSLAVYEEEQNKLIRQILKRSETWVAYSADVPDEILGYAAVEGDVLQPSST